MQDVRVIHPYRDKVVFITGAASGLGLEMARQLVDRGARVMLTDVDEEGCLQAAESLGPSAYGAVLDVTQPEQFERVLDDAWRTLGRIDVLINNAGFATIGESAEVDATTWERIVAVNLMGVVHGCRLVTPRMAAAGGGQIINIASMYGFLAGALNGPYVATKHAVVGLSRSLRIEAKDRGVRVTAVCPGFIETKIFDNAASVPGLHAEDVRKLVPFRFLTVDKAAKTILDGIVKGPELLVFPPEIRLLRWLDFLAPALTARILEKLLRDARTELGS